MKRTAVLLATLAVVVGVIAAPAAGSVPNRGAVTDQANPASQNAANETAERPAPGARLAGVVAVQGAEVEGEVESRAYGIRVARADSNASVATVVAERVSDLRQRTAALEERKRALVEARRDGTITQARFEAEMAALAARNGAVTRQVNRTAALSDDLSADLLESKGTNASAIATLREDARNLSGPDVAAIARSIAGPDVGAWLSAAGNVSVGGSIPVPERVGPPTDRGPPGPTTNSGEPGTVTDTDSPTTEATGETLDPPASLPDAPGIDGGNATRPDGGGPFGEMSP